MTTDLSPVPARPGAVVEPAELLEDTFAGILAGVLAVERVPVDAHFFDDLGADSMVMAGFCARVRKTPGLPSVSMRDVYRHGTVRSLAAALAATGTPSVEAVPQPESTPRAGSAAYLVCGALQLLLFLGYTWLVAVVLVRGFAWITAGSDVAELYLRSVLVGSATWVGLCLLPIAAKWLLVGRWKPEEFGVWSPAYLRFWVVKTLIRSSPLVLFVGSPLYNVYLRALGANVGSGALVLSRHVPVCTDLLTVGAGAVVRKDSFLTCYRAEAGRIRTGTVSIGSEAVVGEAAVLDIETSIGDRARLGHSSSLLAGQAVPDDECWDGYAARGRSPANHRTPLERLEFGSLRPIVYTCAQVLVLLLAFLPLAFVGAALLAPLLPPLADLFGPGRATLASTTFDALTAAGVLYAGFLVVTLLVIVSVPRLLYVTLEPDRAYRLYGFHYWAHRGIERLTNPAFFPRLLGDSSYIVHYLRWLGYDLSDVEQTGSNFGLEVKHENPYLSTVGRGTMAADGLSIINTDLSGTAFRLTRTTIGSRSFLGNYIVYPPEARTGDNCLLATKLMVPVDGDVREGVGLLGAPAFEIPRSVQRDGRFDQLARGEERRARLAAKNRHNAVSIALYVVAWWLFLAGVLLLGVAAAEQYAVIGAWAFAFAAVLALAFRIGYFVLIERASTLFRRLQPRYCSIYDTQFWQHERFWKLATQPLILDGTPYKSLTWRLMGVRIGKRVFDDGCAIVEKTLTAVGDDCTLGTRSVIQAHSQEDGTFKSDHITIGARCTLGIGALVHYGASLGDDSTLAPDSFLMKGEQVPAHARWGGNPARELR